MGIYPESSYSARQKVCRFDAILSSANLDELSGVGTSGRSCPFAYGGFRSKQTKEIWAAPASGGVALYLAVKQPLDRARRRSRPIRVTIAPPRAPAAYATLASVTQTIRTGALLSPACCTVAAASTYIRSSANGSYQNPAYSWQLGSKMDGTRLSYG